MLNLSKTRDLNGFPSIFLDALRFAAAIIVFITHARAIWYPQNADDMFWSNISHGAVVIFFVLSGFVIAHTTSRNNRGFKEYTIARLSRLYSIFLPAILITLAVNIITAFNNPNVLEPFKQSNTWLRYACSIFYCNEIWFLSSAPKLNGPIWSLSYEFWYYAIFGTFFYKKAGIKGFIIPIILCLIAGPKILLLMLMWLLGWLVYYFQTPRIKEITAWIFVVILLMISIYLMIYLPSMPFSVHEKPLFWAGKFISDWIVSIFVALALCILPKGRIHSIAESRNVKMFRKLANLTFPIYVLHFPILVMMEALLFTIGQKYQQFLIGSIIAFFICSVIGILLESKRKLWTTFFQNLIALIFNKSAKQLPN
jgi:peptidoglycan/LPS O-acetylase OafA/YrhL